MNTMSPRVVDLRGRKFGRLTVTSLDGYSAERKALWLCLCECGRSVKVQANWLRSGNTASCGCLRRDLTGAKLRTHGLTKTPTHRTWIQMKTRCTNPKAIGWRHYGGRGIGVCERWAASFENFLADMGERPAGKTIDRIDPNGNYGPANCRWATHSEQVRNRRPR